MKKMGQSNRINRSFSREMIDQIIQSNKVLIFTHVAPDGDTIGSAIGLQRALEKAGKKVKVVCSDLVPQNLLYMDKVKEIAKPQNYLAKDFDLAIAVDVSDQLRLGESEELFFAIDQNIQIDHHGTNPHYAKLNFVDESASATGIIMFDLIETLNISLDKEISTALYTGLTIDTGNFSFDNTTAETLEVASKLVSYGVEVNKINRLLFREKSVEQTKILAKALSSLTYYENHQIAGMCLTKEELKNILPEETDGIVNYGIDITGVKMAFFGKETENGIKFSLRSIVPYDVAKIAGLFHGGGHPLAAGCTIKAPMEEALHRVAQAMVHQLNEGKP